MYRLLVRVLVILRPSSFILHPSSFILHPSSFILHLVFLPPFPPSFLHPHPCFPSLLFLFFALLFSFHLFCPLLPSPHPVCLLFPLSLSSCLFSLLCAPFAALSVEFDSAKALVCCVRILWRVVEGVFKQGARKAPTEKYLVTWPKQRTMKHVHQQSDFFFRQPQKKTTRYNTRSLADQMPATEMRASAGNANVKESHSKKNCAISWRALSSNPLVVNDLGPPNG